MSEFDKIRKSLKTLEDPFSVEGGRSLLKSNPYDNIFEKGEVREFISPTSDSKYLTPWDDPRDVERIEAKKADRQPWSHKASRGLARVGTKVLSEIAKMPGVLGGIVAGGVGQLEDAISGQDNTDFMQTAFNNTWVKAIEDAEQTIKDEALPVYVKKAIKEGNLWDNITSIDFWATDAADGLGYIISMLAPGAAINKIGVGAKLLKLNKLGVMAEKTETAAKALQKAGILAKNIDLHTSTIANTLFEAGAEARSAMDGYVSSLDRRRLLHPEDPNYITDAQYEELLQKQSKVGQNVFLANAAILIGPNAIMSKMIWGNKLNKGKLPYNKTTNLFEKAEALSKKATIQKWGNRFASGTLREGFWEEGLQSTAENYFTKNEDAGLGDFVGALTENYVDTVSSLEGQKAIFLGAIFGGTMQAVFEGKQDKQAAEVKNKLIDNANVMLARFDSFFDSDNEIDEEGNEKFDANGELVKRAKKVQERGEAINSLEVLSMIYDEALATGDVKTKEDVQDIMTTNLIKPFIYNEEMGLDALRQHLEASSSLLAQSKREDFDKKKYIDKIMKKATKLKESYDTFNNFNDIFIELTNKKAGEAQKNDFLNNLVNSYINNEANLSYLEEQNSKNEVALKEALDSHNTTEEDLQNNPAKLRDLSIMDKRIPQLLQKKKELLGELDKGKQNSADIWNEKKLNELFNKEVEEDIIATKKQEGVKKANDIMEAIRNAADVETLKSIEIPQDEEYSPMLNKLKEETTVALLAEKDKKQSKVTKNTDKNTAEEDKKKLEAAERAKYIKDAYNEGEAIPVEGLDIPPGFEDSVLHSVGETEVVIRKANAIEEEGKYKDEDLYTIPTIDFHTAIYNPDDQYSNHDSDVVEEENENILPHTVSSAYDARIAITDNQPNARVLFPDLYDAYKVEIAPRDKTGYYGISINNSVGVTKGNSNYAKAFKEYQENGVTSENIEFLMDNLSLNINLTKDIGAPLENRPARDKSQKEYDAATAQLKNVIFQELLKGTKLSDIQIRIKGQYSGTIQLETDDLGRPAENNIADLYYFDNIDDVVKHAKDFYIVNDIGMLENIDKDIYATQRTLRAKGEIYLMIKTANGTPFPLKLNVAKVTTKQAELLHSLYTGRFDDFENGKVIARMGEERNTTGRNTPVPIAITETFKKDFPEAWSLLQSEDIDESNIKMKDIIDLFIFDATSNVKSRVKFVNGMLYVGSEVFTKEEFDADKDRFVTALTSIKRQHIKFRKKANDTTNLNFRNPLYIKYLIKNGILNTNAIADKTDPVFQGRTTMYVSTDDVLVKGKLSAFNKTTQTLRENLYGTQKKLKEAFKSLFELDLKLTEDSKNYTDKHGNKYYRVSDLVPYDGDPSGNEAANKRGNVIDLLLRDFFSPNQELTSLDRFINAGEQYVEEQNEETGGAELKMDDVFFESLYNTFSYYRNLFNEKEYTVYSNVPPVAFKMNDKLYAGTVDLLIYDNKNKSWKIIDLKTSSEDRADSYNNTNKYKFKGKDVIQQNAYREGFHQSGGKTITSLEILPIQTKSVSGQPGNYIGQKAQQSSVDLLTVSTEKTIFELKSGSKGTLDTFKAEDYNAEVITVDDEMSDDEELLGAYDDIWGAVTGKDTQPKPETKVEPKVEQVEEKIVEKKLSPDEEGRAQLGRKEYDVLPLDGKEYALTNAVIEGGKVVGGLLVYDTVSGLVTDGEIIKKVIEKRNMLVAKGGLEASFLTQPTKIGPQGIGGAIVRATGSEIKAAPAKKEVTIAKKRVEGIDYLKLTKDEAKTMYMNLYKAKLINSSNQKTINQLVKNKTPQEMLKTVVEFLVKQGENREEVMNVCKK